MGGRTSHGGKLKGFRGELLSVGDVYSFHFIKQNKKIEKIVQCHVCESNRVENWQNHCVSSQSN